MNPAEIFEYPHLILGEIEAKSREEGIPLLSREAARAIYQLCALVAPKKILELGCGIGYSAGWLACAMEKGEFHLSDYNASYLKRTKNLINRINPKLFVSTHKGESTLFLEQSREEFDLIFVDIDKVFYERVLELALPRLAPKSLLIFDNACFSGRTFSPIKDKKNGVESIRATILALRSTKLISNLWRVGDGLLVAFKSAASDNTV